MHLTAALVVPLATWLQAISPAPTAAATTPVPLACVPASSDGKQQAGRASGTPRPVSWKAHATEDMRANPTPTEELLTGALRRRLMLSIETQANILGWTVDVYIPAARLVVEIDGRSYVGREAEDGRRDEQMRAERYTVVRVLASDVERDVDPLFLEHRGRDSSPLRSPAACITAGQHSAQPVCLEGSALSTELQGRDASDLQAARPARASVGTLPASDRPRPSPSGRRTESSAAHRPLRGPAGCSVTSV